MAIVRSDMSERSRGFRISVVALAAAAFVLSACEGTALHRHLPFVGETEASLPPADHADVSCPLSGVMEDMGELGRFAREPRTVPNLLIQARVTEVSVDCELSPEHHAGLVDLTIEIIANRGPASTESSSQLYYFVALADPADRIFAREAFSTTIDFRNTDGQARRIEELALTVPIEPATRLGDYRIYVGFQAQPPGG